MRLPRANSISLSKTRRLTARTSCNRCLEYSSGNRERRSASLTGGREHRHFQRALAMLPALFCVFTAAQSVGFRGNFR
jgi:hypothetical protein